VLLDGAVVAEGICSTRGAGGGGGGRFGFGIGLNGVLGIGFNGVAFCTGATGHQMVLQSEVKPERLVEILLIFAVLHRLPCHLFKIALEALIPLHKEKDNWELYLQNMD